MAACSEDRVLTDLRQEWEGRIISVVKPAGISSFGVIHRLRKACGIARIGHAGTLDPFAEGILIVGIGRTATRQLGGLMKGRKEYLARVALWSRTDTGDHTGRVIETVPPRPIAFEEIRAALERFRGEIQQVPPIYSALKVGGKPMYKFARKGKDVEREARPVVIYDIELLDADPDGFRFRVECGQGTYIRTLAEDIAAALGACGHLKSLVRTRVGDHRIEDAPSLEELAKVMREGKRSG